LTEQRNDILEQKYREKMEKIYKNCQSCECSQKDERRRTIRRLEKHNSALLLSGWSFTTPDITLDEMKTLVKVNEEMKYRFCRFFTIDE